MRTTPATDDLGPRTPSWRAPLVLVTALLVGAACGSNVGDETLAATNGARPGTEAGARLASGTTGHAAAGARGVDVVGPGQGSPTAGPGGIRSGGEGRSPAAGGGATGGTGASAPGEPRGAASEILLGSFGTQTGPIGAQLVSVPVAIRAWTSDVNARGGLAGHPVRVITYDDGGDPGRAVAAVRRLVEDDGVLALFGGFGAATTHAVAPYLEEQGVPMVGGVPAPAADSSPMIFNPQTGGTKGTWRSYVATVLAQSEERDVAVLYCREADTCSGAAGHIAEYGPRNGLRVVYEASVSIAQPDYTAEVLAARNAGARVVLMSMDAAAMKRVVSSAHRQGWRPVFAGASGPHVPGFIDGRTDVEGFLGAATVAPWSASPKMADYRDAVAGHVPGGELGEYGAQVWVAGKLLERIAGHFGEPVTREQLFEGLYSLRGETLGGVIPPLTFNEGPHVDVNLCSFPIRVEGGRWVAYDGERPVCARDDGVDL